MEKWVDQGLVVVELSIRDDGMAMSVRELSGTVCRLPAWTMGWVAMAFSETGEEPRKKV